MPDLRRLQEDASAAASSGDWSTAADIYATLEKKAPADGAWPLRLGECLRKLGKQDDALNALIRALKVYARQHMRNKAVAVCRLMLEMDPKNQQIPGVIQWLNSPAEEGPESTPVPTPIPSESSVNDSAAFQVPASMRKAERARARAERVESTAKEASSVRHEAPVAAGEAKPIPRVVMPRTPFFSAMNERQLRLVNERAHLVELEPGQILYALGDTPNALFLVAAGQIAVLLPQEIGRMKRGDFFGQEVVVLPEHARMATTRAIEASQVLALGRDLVRALVEETPALLEILSQDLRERLIAQLAATSPMLASLDMAARLALLARFTFVETAKNEPVYDSDAPDAGLFVLLAGQAVAYLDGRLTERVQPGDIFGELGLVSGAPVRTVLTTCEKTYALHLPRSEFEALRAEQPALVEYLNLLAESRLHRLKQAQDPRVTSSQSLPLPPHLLLLHDDNVTLHVFEGAFSTANFIVDSASDVETALRLIAREKFDVVLCNFELLKNADLDVLGEIRRHDLDIPILLTTSDPSVDTAGAAASHSVVQTFVEPVALPEVLAAASRAAQFHRLTRLRRQAMARLNRTGEWMGDQAGLNLRFRGAIEHLWIAYQPIVSSSVADVVAFEALLRSNDEVLRTPIALFRAAERLRCVHDLGRIIRDKVAAAATQLATTPILCINLHSQDLSDPHLLDPDSPLSSLASRVFLEVTERTPLDELVDLRARLAALRAIGYRFALDDLGAGHAGVASLAQLEPDLAKLDISLIRGIDEDPDKQDLVRSMLGVCTDMNVQVICEGVETDRERDVLVGLGADLMQGYLFAKPAPDFPTVDPSTLPRRK